MRSAEHFDSIDGLFVTVGDSVEVLHEGRELEELTISFEDDEEC